MENEFLKTLKKTPVQHDDNEALDVLDTFCQGIVDFTNSTVQCWRKPGFTTNFGQEWRVSIKSASRDYEQILFRAYVPLNGHPIMLDLYAGEMVTCQTIVALRRELNKFLQQQTVRETIEYLSR